MGGEVQAGDREVRLYPKWQLEFVWYDRRTQEKYRSYIQKIKERLAVLNSEREYKISGC